MLFLERFQPEVAGRSEVGPADELMRAKLKRFVEGACSEIEREELCAAMRDNPALVRWVADQVKKTRDRKRGINGSAPAAK